MFVSPRFIFLASLMLLVVACTQTEQPEQGMSSQNVTQPVVSHEVGDTETLESKLVFEPARVDMGSVKEGEEATVYLRVRNSGDAMAQIADVQTSCGCSVAEPEERLLMPGGFTRIKVVIDTFAKLDDVKKWVSLTDTEGRSSKAWLTLNVRPNPHMGDSSRSIFDGKCAACHFDTAKGKSKGPELYKAVCGMCHGAAAEGAAAPALRQHRDKQLLSTLIANGTGSQHMPGFALKEGGPLTDEQISALSEWLSELDE
ncbi:cytochrome c [Mariprofundus micogutta]|uniref:Cytochrome c n=1 Tax=Mariprofundus micogutta TaxID=1921010 RepID=A0A1L8CNW3_9PROT|nr:DUF1573 domain-containing protein [Mariprofundus micogutta]GAV20573.1 cytochrome c [Mariprofundus micogutta]